VNVCGTTVVRDAWRRGVALSLHGWVYDVADGLLRDLGMCVADGEALMRRAEVARRQPVSRHGVGG